MPIITVTTRTVKNRFGRFKISESTQSAPSTTASPPNGSNFLFIVMDGNYKYTPFGRVKLVNG